MAATVTHRGTTWVTTGGNTTVVATPAVGDLIVVIASATGVATTAVTDTQSGTYVQVDSNRTGFSTTGTMNAWVRTALIPAASSTTWTATQTSSTGGGLTVISVSGMTLLGAAAVRSSGGQSTGTAATTPAPVLSLTPLTTNPVITALSNGTSPATITPRTGYTEDTDLGYATPTTGLEVSHRASGETSATLTYGSTSATAFASIALELAFNSAPTTALNTPVDTATGQSTTPTLNFTGTDPDSDTVEYNVQVDTVNTFDSNADQVNASGGFSQIVQGSGGTTEAQGQSFVAGASYNTSRVDLQLKKTGVPADGVYLEIASSSITGTTLGTSNTISGSTITTSLATYSFTFSTPIALSNGVKYYLRLFRTGARDTNNYFSWGSSAGTNPYASGGLYTLASGVWGSENATFDMVFSVFKDASFPLNKLSTVDTGFTAGHPFTSGVAKDFTVQVGDTLAANTTYYWRVRAIDPTGSNTYGAWSTTRSFTTSVAINTANFFLMF